MPHGIIGESIRAHYLIYHQQSPGLLLWHLNITPPFTGELPRQEPAPVSSSNPLATQKQKPLLLVAPV